MGATTSGRRLGRPRHGAMLAVACGFIAWTSVSLGTFSAPAGAGGHPIILSGAVYEGNASCTECHAEDEPEEMSGQMIGDEQGIWDDFDPHKNAYETLSEQASKAIAEKLAIAEPTTDSKCLSCHGMDVKSDFRGEQFDIDDAVGCESCHGPAGGGKGDAMLKGWLEPHEDTGWTGEKREKLGAKGLREKFGLIDTSALPTRAERCVTCHLKIDQKMIDAEHPRLEFELAAYSAYLFPWTEEYDVHWDDSLQGPMIAASLWAVGQAVANDAGVDDAGLAAVYAKGFEIAKKHFEAADAEGLAKAKLTSKKCLDAAAELAAAAAMAKNEMECNIFAYGVGSLATAAVSGRGADAESLDDELTKPLELGPSVEAAAADDEEKRAAFVAALQDLVRAATPE